MPEGDTIHRVAMTLRPALVGRRLAQVELPRVPRPHPVIGSTVSAIEARGKHLLISTDDGRTIHTHLRMTGSWHLYRLREPWRRSRRAARVVLATDEAVAVCFSAPIVEVVATSALERHPTLRQLGPDLCRADADLDEALRRLRRLPEASTTIAEALLDQRIACGVGNVYRCDLLFLHGLDPTTPCHLVDDPTARGLLADAHRLLRANLTTSARTTVPGRRPGALWVHGRGGQPCRRCGTSITVTRHGEQARYLYHCPRCQPPGADRTGSDRTGRDRAGADRTGSDRSPTNRTPT